MPSVAVAFTLSPWGAASRGLEFSWILLSVSFSSRDSVAP